MSTRDYDATKRSLIACSVVTSTDKELATRNFHSHCAKAKYSPEDIELFWNILGIHDVITRERPVAEVSNDKGEVLGTE